MSWQIASICLGLLMVAMVTGAPVSDQGVVKRADERIVFGNQQNKARVVSKRSDLADTDQTSDTPAQGELDKGSEVLVHEEKSVEKDLADRADAARKDFEDQGKMADAMEAAMQSVDIAKSDIEKSEEESSPQTAQSEQTSDSEEASSTADTTANSEETDDGAHGEAEHSVTDEDSDIEDLLKVTGEGQNDDQDSMAEQSTAEDQSVQGDQQASTGVAATDESSVRDTPVGQVQAQPGTELAPQPGETDPQLGDFWTQMYQYMDAYPASARLPFDLYRGRRSLAGSKKSGSRRIKRDLLDDIEYDPDLIRYLYSTADGRIDTAQDEQYDPPTSSVLDMGDSLLADQDDYVPLTDSDAEDLYNELEEYLQWELQRRAGIEKLRETLGLAPRQEADSTDLASVYGGEGESGDGVADDRNLLDAYSYGTEYPADGSYYYASKRSSPVQGVYNIPTTDTEKRYFFPFADEPETHWGAFVPEKRRLEDDMRSAYLDDAYTNEYRGPSKRDYNEAIQRLQRLAMALSDNHDPYYTELVQDQPYKK